MRFNFYLRNHAPGGVSALEDALRFISAGMVEGGHEVQFEYTHLMRRPFVNIIVEHFPDDTLAAEIAEAKAKWGDDLILGLMATEDLSDTLAMSPDLPRRNNLLKMLNIFDFVWLLVPDFDYNREITAGREAQFLAFGHAPSLQLKPAVDQTIDVLLYGRFTTYRAPVFHRLIKAGVRVEATFGDMPEYVRQNMIARSKIVLDIRRGDVVRYLSSSRILAGLQYGSLVVAETFDESLLAKLYRYTIPAAYDELADVCLEWLGKPDAERQAKADELRALFAAETSMCGNIRQLLHTIPAV